MNEFGYRLIDFGDGRKLESLAGYRICRPSAAAVGQPALAPQQWRDPDASFEGHEKRWHFHRVWPRNLTLDCGGFRMPVRPTPYGHIGLFPEQSENWRWLQSAPPESGAEPRQALNLFAYTGAGTMALVSAGYRVAHVDAAKPNVQAAREAAELNGWGDRPIRYLVDDAAKFAAREARRGRRYDVIVLDPPAYGHSPRGRAWRLERDLWPLLETCLRLVRPEHFRLLVTGHSAAVGAGDVLDALAESSTMPLRRGRCGLRIDSGRSQLEDAGGRPLDAGFFVRVDSPAPQMRSSPAR